MRTYTVSSAFSVMAYSGKWVMYLAPTGIAVTVYNSMHSRPIVTIQSISQSMNNGTYICRFLIIF